MAVPQASGTSLLADLRLPLMAAPMFIASSLELARACCRAGVLGAFQAGNARTLDEFRRWIGVLEADAAAARAEGRRIAPYAVNLPATGPDRHADQQARLDICAEARVPLLITSNGNPADVVRLAHGWGGRVFHDITTIPHAHKAADAGVDGMMLTTVGSGGHAGPVSPFALLPQVRQFFDGTLVLAGGMASGVGIAAAIALGADLVAMGTRFIATEESGVEPAYKQMLVDVGTSDILFTDAISGLAANFMRSSMRAVGLDPDNLPPPRGLHRPNMPEGIRAWKHVWSGGHSVGLIDAVLPVAELVDRLAAEFEIAQRDTARLAQATLARMQTSG